MPQHSTQSLALTYHVSREHHWPVYLTIGHRKKVMFNKG
ncbi:unnamed protein product [Nyctereutes procyonoides]|uniref:(raccoon dog) hypothetical protein n=1 Tax=Nyctereutes procyonoides TaxID=34880 RepID=A0A812A0S0_NYCPR|nr:unnamed protein product [Nyctereutes procyonoides]